MTKVTEEMVERAARKMCWLHGASPDEGIPEPLPPFVPKTVTKRWEMNRHAARCILEAALNHKPDPADERDGRYG